MSLKFKQRPQLHQALTWITLVLLWPFQAVSGGWTSSGGGSGVVCFQSRHKAAEFDRAIGKRQRPANKVFDAVTSVQPLDYYEAAAEVQAIINKNWLEPVPFSGTGSSAGEGSWLNLHGKVQKRIKLLSPLFGIVLETSKEKLLSKAWVKQPFLPLIKDQYDSPKESSEKSPLTLAKSIIKKDPKCRLVQILRRVSDRPLVSTEEAVRQSNPIPEQFGRVRLEYVEELFEKMTALGKSMIFLHEQLYFMGDALGHPSSEVDRYWVREFLMLDPDHIFQSPELKFVVPPEDRFTQSQPEIHGFQNIKAPGWLRARLTSTFGDYVLFYIHGWGGVELRADPQSLFSNFLDLLRRARAFMGRCLDSPTREDQRSFCFEHMKKEVLSSDQLSEQEEFIYLGWMDYGRAPDGMLNYEYLFTPDRDLEISEQRDKAKMVICRQIKSDLQSESGHSQSAELRPRFVKALRYCQEILQNKNDL